MEAAAQMRLFAAVDFWLSIDEVKTAMVLSCQRAGMPVLGGDGINFSGDFVLARLQQICCHSIGVTCSFLWAWAFHQWIAALSKHCESY